MGEIRGAYKVLVGKPETNRPLVISERKREDCSKVELQEIGVGGGGRGLDLSGSLHGQEEGSCERGSELSD